MKRPRHTRLALLFLLAAVGGCVTLDEPLSDPMDAKPDDALCGVWKHDGDDTDVGYAFIGVKPGDPGAPQGLMSVALPGFDKKKKTIESDKPMTAFVTRIKDATYLNVLTLVPTSNYTLVPTVPDLSTVTGFKTWKASAQHGVTLVKYRVEADRLTTWFDDDSKAWEPGGAMREKYGKDPAALVALIEKEGDAALFPPAKHETYTRVK